MTARGLGATPGRATWATDRSSPCSPGLSIQWSCLGSWFLEGEFAFQRQVRMPCLASGCSYFPPSGTSQDTLGARRDSSLLPLWVAKTPLCAQLYHHRLRPKEEGYCSFPNSVIHREDEDRHLMLTKISNKEMGSNQISSHSVQYYTLLLLSRKLYVHKNTNTQFCRTVWF